MPRLALTSSTVDTSSVSQHSTISSKSPPDSSNRSIEISPDHAPKVDEGNEEAPRAGQPKTGSIGFPTPDQVEQPKPEDHGDKLQKEITSLYKEALICLPPHVQHRQCKGSDPVWSFFRELQMPVGPENCMFSNVLCLVCLRVATRKKTSWQQALCRITSVDNASTHLVAKHIDDECVIQHFERENDPHAGEAIKPLKNNPKSESNSIKIKQLKRNEIIDVEKSYMTFQSINEASMRSVANVSSNRFGYTDQGLPNCVAIHPSKEKSKAYQFIYVLRVPILRPSHDVDNNTAKSISNNLNPLNISISNDQELTNTPTSQSKHKKKGSCMFYTHICLLCLKDIQSDPNINRDSWKRALCTHKRSRSALAHLRSVHWGHESVMQILSKEVNATITVVTAAAITGMKPSQVNNSNASLIAIPPGVAITPTGFPRGANISSALGLPMITPDTETIQSKSTRVTEKTSTSKKRTQERDRGGMTYAEWMHYFQPIAKKLATHPQQRILRMMMDGVRNAVFGGEEEPEKKHCEHGGSGDGGVKSSGSLFHKRWFDTT